jgi:ABC-type multidrug transport system fused ATPase/permease subunit
MGRCDIDKRFINELCERTGLQSFLASLSAGYDTELDPAGKRLPRNVVQKILLVRALAFKPSLLIMEEPWQGIEEESRNSIQEMILNAKETTAMIATSDDAFSGRCHQIIHLAQKSAS